jgi:hypothetical protein
MKVYGLRELQSEYSFMPVVGYHSSLQAAKKHAKELFNKTAEYDICLYEVPTNTTLDMWVNLLNGDSLSSVLTGDVPRDHLKFVKIAFESAAMKRYRKEEK